MNPRDLTRLTVLNSAELAPELPLERDRWALATCQRRLVVATRTEGLLEEVIARADVHRGAAAYEFLLRVASGLESELAGEAEILGQIRDAWARFEAERGSDVEPLLARVFRWLLEDAKHVRAEYLQGLGSASYGSWVRRWLRGATGPAVLVGAGQLARSVAPFLADLDGTEWTLLHRGGEGAASLADERGWREGRLGSPESGRAWAAAGVAVICAPRGFEGEAEAARAVRADCRVIHLGGRRAEIDASGWSDGTLTLDELFAEQKRAGLARERQLAQAARAIRDRAQVRALGGGSLSLAHGWEDLQALGSR